MKLTEKQKRFADYYIETGNATESAKRAGYSEKTAKSIGQENLTKPDIRSYVDQRIAEKDSKRVAKQDEVLEYLTAVMRGEHTEQVLRGVGEGAQTIDEMDVAANQRIRAAELLGKRYGIWTEKQDINVTGAVQFVDDIGDEDGS
ncbi:terminase small subunit [Terribacillus saccharophilus]|uniref:terminase small subunit n=1 Tax=Terribacillus saccharophilus TaxID=361277 RepID=UPI000BA5E72D|nr:terminase small subunit [Terribacillus saccharophilus]PAF34226.1 terminase small subunit [Terribacillus saccharophilus]